MRCSRRRGSRARCVPGSVPSRGTSRLGVSAAMLVAHGTRPPHRRRLGRRPARRPPRSQRRRTCAAARRRPPRARRAVPDDTSSPRYREDRTPSRSSALLCVPVETVHTRVRRGLAMLRARLDRDHNGDRHTWAVALARGRRGAPRRGSGLRVSGEAQRSEDSSWARRRWRVSPFSRSPAW